MRLESIKEVIRRKPVIFVLISLGYLLVTGFLKWGVHPTAGLIVFIIGGLVGVYFLDIAEVFFHLTPSPFRSVVFSWAFAVVGLFILTSSGSMLASGLVLSLYLSLILWQVGEWELHKNLNDWYRMIREPVGVSQQLWMLIGFIVLFVVETYFFIRW